MDTATHFAMGFGLAGLAHLDPVVASTPGLAEAVMIGTVIGSQAPDLDGFTRIRGSAAYIRHHRGVSHSIPALSIWTAAVFALVQAISPQVHWLHLLGWIFVAVCLHVFVDLFNAYGTKGLYPFHNKWIAWNVVFIFDPFIFAAHVTGLMLWGAGADPGHVFLWVYLSLIPYYFWRWQVNKRTTEAVRAYIGKAGTYTVIPTLSWNQWTFVVQTNQHWYVGEVHGGEVSILDVFTIKPENELIAVAKTDKKVQAFLSFVRHAHVETRKQPFGYEVRWFDLRYRARYSGKSHYMFVAVVYLDNDMNIRDSFVGWIHRGEEQLAKKLDPDKEIQMG
ncbi:metal-dependent hydrolase [Brevibacillus borstelensis]|uniref:metal-dependent hydrolase n=1 Tax=Brevibacillus borstelensis TaxID=45462 RepID=UPI00148FB8A0|nr:metal-dependent hydrolase [Brevibacillus borstelensis]MCC0565936.1 metal-dependent hydrolase [Brevibacillus borstelensis]MCM3591585.1 metal-dependent hydrolase [Brevibacillus borstelensis]MED1852104.1 metal-dependent hydrolase [Brevibacillus borstelensis]NOU54368.1 metal-dependent hydrolase [Brevibacillus borstelensis]